MKHLLFANKTILVGDDAADALVEYGVALAASSTADRVEYTGIGADGGTVQAVFLLNAGAALVAETTPSDLPEPDNTAEVARIRERTRALTGVFPVQPSEDDITFDVELEHGFGH
ncbi:hypothetical protein C5C36_09560 [Rathayibacter sp. AY1G1]|uniref:hypothetical protein n=1 Tax=unclassified Rathayibacter TaxID=2609250 RepID=UPI000CE79A63|nr:MULTISPECIES: hypothetical protein [unclassified Rathayibacter]PPF13101.1 hypothetical protein C5B98_01505 [Rathayibacter sp. AY1A5]PPH05800.1 hypothetical protein C5C44_03530 [Rathayibacter sp. AY1F6]PPH12552.1 hypothetical protein C5C36_09560 [Rathayibacter sp. AY1G1]